MVGIVSMKKGANVDHNILMEMKVLSHITQ